MSYKIDQERDTLPKQDIGSHIGLKLPNAHIETIKKNPIELTLRDQEVSLNALQKSSYLSVTSFDMIRMNRTSM